MNRATYTPVPLANASNHIMPFGVYCGQAVGDIARTDCGLLWLDWARGACDLDYHTKNAVCSYLDDPTIAKDLAELLARKGKHR